MPAHSELAIISPNAIHQSLAPHSGWSATTLGLKHEIGYNAHWLGGQTKQPTEGSGFNVDSGVLYLLTSHLEMDLEVGQNLHGNLGGFDHYFGVGLSVMS